MLDTVDCNPIRLRLDMYDMVTNNGRFAIERLSQPVPSAVFLH